MKCSRRAGMQFLHILTPTQLMGLIMVVIAMTVFLCVRPSSVDAAQTVPYTMNFQGRLTTTGGSPYADGLYNMKFRIFDAATVGTELWTETRETTNRVQVTNGLFSVQLGQVNALSPTLFNSSAGRYFEIELPTPATATCSTAACGVFSEGAMTPRNKLATSAYAFNSDTIDGIDGASLAQLGTNNTFTAANTFNSTVALAGADSASKFSVTNSAGTLTLFTVDTASTIVKVGTTATGTLTNVRLLSTDAEFTGTVRIGSAINGVDISATGVVLSGTARGTKTVALNPEYPSAVFTGDGTNNNGTLTSDFCSNTLGINASFCDTTGVTEANYYKWSTAQATAQDYDIYIRYQLPSDYSTGSMTNLSFKAAVGTAGASEVATLALFEEGSATACTTTANAATVTGGWNTATQVSPIGACTLAAGDYVILKVSFSATSANTHVATGDISFSYRSTF